MSITESVFLIVAILSPFQDLPNVERSRIQIVDTGDAVRAGPMHIDGGPVVGDMLNYHFFPGVKNFNAGRYGFAVGEFNYVLDRQNYLEMNPRKAEYVSTAYYLRGLIYLYHADGLGRFSAAKEDFEGAIKANPNNFVAYLELSRVYSALGLKEAAISLLQTLQKANPDKTVADEVESDLNKLVASAPASAFENASPATSSVAVPVAKVTSAKPDPSKTGTIAINSGTWADVYLAGKQLGSTPLTLTLPEGMYTFQYRREELSKSVTYVIKANETITATVNFDVTLNINAMPWAEVIVEGASGSLGQTPLADVQLPVGALLLFRNPAFPEKRHQVLSTDRSIAVTFP